MKILVIGSGGREHALCWSISKSPLCKKIYCLPGNAGIKEEAECVNIKIDNHNAIIKFIKHCKTYENEKGYLTQSFFKTMVVKKAQFISGPFTNMIFEILEKQKNKLKILVSNIVMTIPNKTNYLYRPI